MEREPEAAMRAVVNVQNKQLITAGEQRKRANFVRRIEASERLNGYEPLSEGYAYELNQQWIKGEITKAEKTESLIKHYGLAK